MTADRSGARTSDAGRPLRVLLLLGTSGGGVGRHVRGLAAELVQGGHAVLVGGPASTERDFGFTFVGAAFVAVEVRESPRPAADLRAARAIGRLARRADVVHAHGLRVGGLAVLARRRGTPLVVTLHNALLARGVGGSPVRVAYAVLERLVARGADAVLGVSADLESRLAELGARDVRHAVVPAPAGPPPAARERTRTALAVGDRLVVLCIARLAEQKGLPLLLDAVARLTGARPGPARPGPTRPGPARPGPARVGPARVGPALELAARVAVLVAGDGPLRGALQQRIDAEGLPVRLLGWRDDVADLLAAADVVVSTAVWEGQPIAVQQALRAGRALVATAVGGTAQVTGDAAVLVPEGDAPALAQALRRVLDDPVERARLEAAARARGAALPTEADAVAAALAVYRDVVEACRPPSGVPA